MVEENIYISPSNMEIEAMRRIRHSLFRRWEDNKQEKIELNKMRTERTDNLARILLEKAASLTGKSERNKLTPLEYYSEGIYDIFEYLKEYQSREIQIAVNTYHINLNRALKDKVDIKRMNLV